MSALHNTSHWGLPDRPAPRAGERIPRGPWLPFGAGRSYGDVCRNDAGTLVLGEPPSLFERQADRLTLDAGWTLGAVLARLEGTGLFLPVLPGTRFVTVGGAIANDVHGKNHHGAGTFGCHVERIALRRSDGGLLDLRPGDPLFAATIGGMGLTGRIERATLRLKHVPSSRVVQRTTPFTDIADAERTLDTDAPYSVAWIDSLATGRGFGRGHWITGDHAPEGAGTAWREPRLSVPFTPPLPLVAGVPLHAFNALYRRTAGRAGSGTVDAARFFFPLDGIARWNRLYGPRGLHQHQSIVSDLAHVERLMRVCLRHGQASFLTVLKRFGGVTSPGLLSFPREGWTLTLDLPDRGARTRALLQRLDAVALEAGGRVNPYKARAMSADTFRASFPDWRELEKHRDRDVMSDLWRRVSHPEGETGPPLVPAIETRQGELA